jgi:transcriptional regulator with XRE-family HTH domain
MRASERVSLTVERLLVEQGMSRSELGRRLGVSPPAVVNKLHGRRRWTVDELDDLAAALGVTVQRLVATVRYRLERATVTTRYQSSVLSGHVENRGGLLVWTGR